MANPDTKMEVRPMQAELTPKQQRFFSYLEREIIRTGKAPSLRQAAAEMDVSHAAVSQLVKALEENNEKVGVNLQKLSQARRLLDPFLTEDRRSLPKDGSPACAACQFSTREVCCQR